MDSGNVKTLRGRSSTGWPLTLLCICCRVQRAVRSRRSSSQLSGSLESAICKSSAGSDLTTLPSTAMVGGGGAFARLAVALLLAVWGSICQFVTVDSLSLSLSLAV